MWATTGAAFSGVVAARFPPLLNRDGYRCRAGASSDPHPNRKKVVVVGAGWAGLASARHLSKQGFDVTLLEAGSGPAEEVGVRGFWYPYRNIFSLADELGIQPFTKWTRSAYYSPGGMEAEFPIFQDMPGLPTPLGALVYPQFFQLPLVDRLTSVPLMVAVIDFDNTDAAWRKYDSMTARELFKQYGCSASLYQKAFEPLLQVGLFGPAEQCSAAATLGMLYYYILSHQQNFDVVWCRGKVEEKIFWPWLESMKVNGLKFRDNKMVTDFMVNEDTGCISGVVCGQEIYEADAFILAVGVSTLQSTVISSSALQSRQEFLNVLSLDTIDVLSVKLWFDRKVEIPKKANVCSGFDDSTGWTFFDLNSIYDECKEESATVLEAEFYNATWVLLLSDEQIVAKVVSYLSMCIKEFQEAIVLQHTVARFPKSATHFFPEANMINYNRENSSLVIEKIYVISNLLIDCEFAGSYKYMLRGSTTFPNLFMAGDWIVTRHGSWSQVRKQKLGMSGYFIFIPTTKKRHAICYLWQEKAYVTGLEAANRVIDYLGEGDFAKIIPVEEDEPHIEALRSFNRQVNELKAQIPFSDFFL